MTTHHPTEDLAGYALGTLDTGELAEIEQHLAECSVCRAEAARLTSVVNQLPLTAEMRPAPTRARARLLESIASKPAAPARPAKTGAWPRPAVVLAVAATLLALVAGASLIVTMQSLNRMSSELSAMRQQLNDQAAALQVLSSENSRLAILAGSTEAPSAGARIVFDPTGHRALVGVSGFPSLDPDKTFQLWLWRGTERISCATFNVDNAGTQTVSIWAKDDLASYEGMGVTVEPKGGSPWPTGQRVVGGRF